MKAIPGSGLYHCLILLLLVIAVAAWAPTTLAEEEEGAPEQALASVDDGAEEEDASQLEKKSNIHMGEEEIKGEIDRPNAMFIITRAVEQYRGDQLKRSFIDEILEPVSKSPFEKEMAIITFPVE
ncbi:hypothetical protein ACFL4G_07000 [Thermodesulfobacteriota bacterium]